MTIGENLPGHPPRGVAWDREADPPRLAAGDGGGDPHHAAVDVDERTAGVARVDRGVGLEELLERIVGDPAAADAADDPVGDRAVEAEGIADRPDHLADLDGVAVAPCGGRQVVGIDPEDGQVARRVAADELRLEIAAIGELHTNAVHLGDDVIVGQDHPGGVHDHARPERLVGEPGAVFAPQRADLVGERPHPAGRGHVHNRRADDPRERREELSDAPQLRLRGRVADRRELRAGLRVLDPPDE